MNNFTVKERQVWRVVILDIDGKLSGCGSSGTLRDHLQRLMDAGRKQILLNLAHVSYIDSSCLGVLLSSRLAVNNAGGRIKLVHLTRRLRELMAETRLLTIFDVYEDEPTALDSFMQDTGEF